MSSSGRLSRCALLAWLPVQAWSAWALLVASPWLVWPLPSCGGEPDGLASRSNSTELAAVEQLKIEPSSVSLHATNRQQQLLVTAITRDGRSIDATPLARLSVDDPSVATCDGTTLVARRDGTSQLMVEVGNARLSINVSVSGSDNFPPIDFASDIVPVLSKLGCNAGGCHGRVQGQNGFKLSVFGYDPAADFASIVQEGRGRRVFPASPSASLLLQKATANVPHGGGRRLVETSFDYELLSRWIGQGMPVASGNAPRLERISASPRQRSLSAGANQQILATAYYSDGTTRDVTHWAQYASNATTVAEVDARGAIRCGQAAGQAAITVNYMGKIAVVEIVRPRSASSQPVPQHDWPINNEIDQLVWAKLESMGIEPSPLATDDQFMRRLYLDVLGTLPDPTEIQRFLNDTSTTKRNYLIDQVLDRPEAADYWALKWADILLVDKEKLGDRGAYEFHRWLREQFATNRPYDQWVRELVTASGNSGRNGPVNLYRAADTPDAAARTITQAFLGVRLECAQCHHHPFDQWSQADFYGMAGYFNGLEQKPLASDRFLLRHAGYRPITIPITNQPVVTHPLGSQASPPVDGPPAELMRSDPRVVLANWMTKPDNPWFARMFVNRLWKQLFGRGLVEAEDDMRMTNPATNEPLLSWLASEAQKRNYDQRTMLRLMLQSRVYQTSSSTNETNLDDDQNFSHYYARRMPAEVMLDAISSATGSPEHFPGQPPGTRALQLWDNRLPSYFLEIFGRPARNSPCECGRSSEPTMAQALHLINAPEVESKISAASGRVATWFKHRPGDNSDLASPSTEGIIREIALVTVSRLPNEKELRVARELFAQQPPRQAAEDFLWTMLNSYDFLFIQ